MIHKPYQIFYLESLLTITNSAIDSIYRLNFLLNEVDNTKNQVIIDNAQNIINQAAALSRYFWSISKNSIHKSRSQWLRQKLDIKEYSYLKNRDVRNSIEHFDEKLDIFCSTIRAGTIIPIYVGDEIVDKSVFFFRAYFIDKKTFKILDLTYEIEPIVSEIIDIHNQLIKLKAGQSNSEKQPA
ncbi:MAG: hypothetical protein J0I09_03680 [Sphingobacteriia bacterium]|nr:hypothetical protein [Sphingobacteriia bacterium]